MEYYVVRIYRRELSRVGEGGHREIRLTGFVEDDAGHKDWFHNAAELWRFLTMAASATSPRETETGG